MLSRWLPLMVLFSTGWMYGGFNEDGAIASDIQPWLIAANAPISAPGASAPGSKGASASLESPLDTVERLRSRAAMPTEPSQASEDRYIKAMRMWLDSLDPFKQERARKILSSAHPSLQALREAIREKKQQLAGISFNKGMPPETLPRLGMELQQLRAHLSAELRRVSERLRYEAGVAMDPAAEDTFWLSPPADK